MCCCLLCVSVLGIGLKLYMCVSGVVSGWFGGLLFEVVCR